MKNTITTLNNLHADYIHKFDSKTDKFRTYLSRYSLKCYYRVNRQGNEIKRYSLAYGYTNETREMTRFEMIKALKNAIDTNEPLLKIGV